MVTVATLDFSNLLQQSIELAGHPTDLATQLARRTYAKLMLEHSEKLEFEVAAREANTSRNTIVSLRVFAKKDRQRAMFRNYIVPYTISNWAIPESDLQRIQVLAENSPA